MTYPASLETIIELFENLPSDEKRENLIAYADSAKNQEPRPGERFDFEDTRKDEECTDTVGIFLKVESGDKAHFRVRLGPQVQTLTRAMTSILCKGLNGVSLREILDMPQDFVPKIIGSELVRLRSQTVYYVFGRMKSACKIYLDRRRQEQAAARD